MFTTLKPNKFSYTVSLPKTEVKYKTAIFFIKNMDLTEVKQKPLNRQLPSLLSDEKRPATPIPMAQIGSTHKDII